MPEAMSLLVNLASSFSRSLSSLSFSSNSKFSPTPTSSFDFDGTIGLGIVAATIAAGGSPPPPPPRSEPLPILSVAAATAAKMMTRTKERQQRVISIPNRQQEVEEEDDEEDDDEESWSSSMEIDESSESYTCVTSYLGGQPVSKIVYIDDDSIQINSPPISVSKLKSKSKVVLFIGAPPSPPLLGENFLNSCHFCKRSLDRRDIFMYRGEKSFCSQECRYQHVLNDENGDSGLLEALKEAL